MTEQLTVRRVEVYRDSAGEWRWTAKAGNGETVADSGEGYKHRTYAREAATSLFPDATVEHVPEDVSADA